MKVKYSDLRDACIALVLALASTCYDLLVLAHIPITVLVLLEMSAVFLVAFRIGKKVSFLAMVSVGMFCFIVWRNAYNGSIYRIYQILLYGLLFMLLFVNNQSMGNRWFKWFIKLVAIMYGIYAAATWVCALLPGFYLGYVVPLFPENAPRLIRWYNEGCNAGITNHYSTNGMFLSIGVIIGACALITNKKKKKTKYLIAYFLLCMSGLLLTGKRGPLIFTIAALYIMYYFYLSDNKKGRIFRILGLSLLVLIIGFLVISIFPELGVGILRLLDDSDSGDITSGRTGLWTYAFMLFRNNPIVGIGWVKYKTIMQVFTGYDRGINVHNIYIQLLCETGVVGFILFIVFFVVAFFTAAKTYKFIRKNDDFVDTEIHALMAISIAVQSFFILYGLTGNPLYDALVFVPYFSSVAYSHSCERRLCV